MLGLALACLSAVVSACAGDPCRPTPPPEQPGGAPAHYAQTPGPPSGPLVIMGDTQRTSVIECAVLGREVNEREPQMLVRSLVHAAPSALIVVGDLVFRGASEPDWQHFDRLMKPVRDAGIPVLAAAGNHEWRGRDRPALDALGQRFPSLRERTWYLARQTDLGLVFLDSNADALGPAAWAEQREWLTRTLAALEADASVRGVLVFAHHPPYTRSVVVSGDAAVRETVVAAAASSPKVMAIFSGHAHGYERYVVDGLHLVVSAGGGGPRPSRLRGTPRPPGPQDLVSLPAPRPLHYMIVARAREGLRVRVMGLQRGDAAVAEVDFFTIPWASGPLGPEDPAEKPGGDR
ncbi:MAG: metallophosphoesterase [Myxococcota bacterium]